MQFKHLALSALVAGANAQLPPEDIPIILSVLPTSALAYISASGPAAFSNHIYSVFAAGSTPGWYENLPTSVQTDLVPSRNSTLPSGTGVIVNSNSSSLVVTKSSTTITKPATPKAPTTTGGGSGDGSGGGSGGGSGSDNGSASSSSFSDFAVPTAVVGAGLAGVVGLVGLFAL